MLELKTAIEELRNGVIEFIPTGSGCLTEVEAVLLLEKLEQLRKFS